MSTSSSAAPSSSKGRPSLLLVGLGVVLCLAALVFPPLAVIPLAYGVRLLIRSLTAPGIVLTVLATVCAFIGLTAVMPAVFLKPYRSPSESMAPTLEVGDRFFVNRLSSPGVGDVAVFHAPEGAIGLSGGSKCGEQVTENELCPRPAGGKSDLAFVKRIVAGPGDRLEIRGGRVLRNGRQVSEPYARACDSSFGCSFEGEITVPDGHWYMLGDNRGQSDDSRFWGAIPDDWVVGKVIGRYWPPGEIGGL